MTLAGLRLRSLLFHWRGNLAVLLGVALGAAVLTGALLVGDSLRGSLRDLTRERLGWIEHALVGPRFLRGELAAELEADAVSPAVVLRGTLGVKETVRAARGVSVLGVDRRFWLEGRQATEGGPGRAPVDAGFWDGETPGVVVNGPLAAELAGLMGITSQQLVGRTVYLRVQKSSDIPRETLLGRRDDEALVGELRLEVKGVLGEGEFGDRFSLQPTAEVARSAYVPLAVLQRGIEEEGRVNAFFVAGADPEKLRRRLHAELTLDDWGLKLVGPRDRTRGLFARLDRNGDGRLEGREWYRRVRGQQQPLFAGALAAGIEKGEGDVLTWQAVDKFFHDRLGYLSLESRQLLLEDVIAEAALEAARDVDLRTGPTLVYLANTIADGPLDDKGGPAGPDTHTVPYAIVAALDPTLPPPLGPFLPEGVTQLKDDQIVLVEWKSPLVGEPGRQVTLVYYPPEQHGEYHEERAAFTSAGTIPLEGAALDPYLTPELPGVTDRVDIQGWDPPFKLDRTRIRTGDINEQFWEQYRTAPKAYVTLAAGQKLWGSRYGKLTSLRLVPLGDRTLEASGHAFRGALLSRLDPEKAGLVFQPLREQSLQASSGGTDFAMLFLGFSFFLIVSALLLVGLLFRLNLDRRAGEIGLLLASGYRRSTVRWLLVSEGATLAVVGALLGLGVAVVYSRLLLWLLEALWPGGTLGSFLRPHVTLTSLLIGFAASVLVSLLTILWAVRVLGKASPTALLAGQADRGELGPTARPRWSLWTAVISLVLALVLLAASPWVKLHEMKAMTFFGGGALLLTAALAGVWAWMRGSRHRTVSGTGWWSVARLGVRNAARFPTRSLLTAGLLASAAFLLVAVEAFRRSAEAAGGDAHSSSGGFALLAESDLPVVKNLNSAAARADLLDRLQQQWQKEVQGEKLRQRMDAAEELLAQVVIVPFRVRAGDDASCLNLYQPGQPRVLGVPRMLIDRGGFVFSGTSAETPEEKANPWLVLGRDAEPFPAFGEQNTVMWMLKSSLGGTVDVPAGGGEKTPLRIAGLLHDSIFQSGLLVSEGHFFDLYPTVEGFRFFLIQTPPGREGEVTELLEVGLAEWGLAVTRTEERLAAYLKVENTYLSTFQALGALGLLLGSLGLAVVLLRGVWERRAELALLRALGYRRSMLAWLVLAENGFLLVLGLAAGTAAALIAVAPHLLAHPGQAQWGHLLGLLALVLLVGLSAASLAVLSTLRAPLLPALRKE